MTESPEVRLGRYVRTRRKALQLGQTELGPRGGPSAATVRLIERGEPVSLQRGTKAGLEQSLLWVLGSVDRILEGLEPLDAGNGGSGAAFSGEGTLTVGGPENVSPPDQDADVLGSLPPEALAGLDAADRAEVIAAAKLSALEKAREIRRRLDE